MEFAGPRGIHMRWCGSSYDKIEKHLLGEPPTAAKG